MKGTVKNSEGIDFLGLCTAEIIATAFMYPSSLQYDPPIAECGSFS